MAALFVWWKAAWHFLALALAPVQRISFALEAPVVVVGVAATSLVGRVISSVPAWAFPLTMVTLLAILAGVRLQLRQIPKLAIECGNSDEFRVVGPRSGAEERPRLTLLRVRNLSSLEARRCRVQLRAMQPPIHSVELPRLLRWRGEGTLETDIPGHGVGFVIIAGAQGSALEDSWRIPPDETVLLSVTAWAEGSPANVKQFRLEAATEGWDWPTVAEVSTSEPALAGPTGA